MGSTSFTQLRVWQKSHEITLVIYKSTRNYPVEERFGLAYQMRKAASSVPANIAEGFGRYGAKDRARFYNIARGSAEELKYFLRLSRDLGLLPDVSELDVALDEVCAMLHRLRQRVLGEGDAR